MSILGLFNRKKKKSGSGETGRMLLSLAVLLFLIWIILGPQLPFARSAPLEDLRQQILNSAPVVNIAQRVNPQHQKILESLPDFSTDSQPATNFSGIETQLKDLAGKGELFTTEASKAFDQVVKPSEGDESTLTDRAIKYGQYIYCQQVVEEWEKNL